nr:hypothetical protein [Candidatus Electrothrix aestuarii]
MRCTEKRKRRCCDDRIVSIAQPRVRPIVRGKAGKNVGVRANRQREHGRWFGFVDHIGWDAFNEGTDLQGAGGKLQTPKWLLSCRSAC